MFGNKNIFLNSEIAKNLYKNNAQNQPIFDYHSHLSPKEIYEDKVFENIGQLWLGGDHYKWRLMRTYGIDEKYITGNASYKDKFIKYIEVLVQAIGNPLYHWSHMELSKYFEIDDPITPENADNIWYRANYIIEQKKLSPKKLIEMSNVYFIGTTDDPTDDLKYHILLQQDETFKTIIKPTFRPDNVLLLKKNYIEKLSDCVQYNIKDIETLKKAIVERLDYFCSYDCVITDFGIPYFPNYRGTKQDAEIALKKALENIQLTSIEYEKYLDYMLRFLALEYNKRNMVMQLHLSVIRNVNDSLFEKIGPDSGIDSVNDPIKIQSIARFLNDVENQGGLPKTIVYTLNPTMYYTLATVIGNFQGKVKGKMQLGSAWWFCDHKEGIKQQLKIFAQTGNLGTFIGMLTDSRSFLSYARHDYFRRILCDLIGDWITKGEVPNNHYVKEIVENICFKNAKEYFGE